MKKIRIITLLIFGFLSFEAKSQVQDSISIIKQKSDLLKPKEKNDYKSFSSSYDEENIKLRRVNDTLNVFVGKQKKLSLVALDITSFEEFDGFEKDIDSFMRIIGQLNLNFKEDTYKIRYKPNTQELRVEKRNDSRYQVFDGELLPVLLQEIVFTYDVEMLEVNFFLGEIDELAVLKEASITDFIDKAGEDDGWYEKYDRSTFNKDLVIQENGETEIITYANLEETADLRIKFGLDVGASLIGKEVPFRQELSLLFDSEKYNKWTNWPTTWKSGIYFSMELYQFFSKDDENRFRADSPVFANLGLVSGPKDYPIGLYYGRLVSGGNNDFFQNNKNKFGLDILIESKFRIKYEVFIGSNESDWISSIGLSFPIINNR
jgi:hypothetical protein